MNVEAFDPWNPRVGDRFRWNDTDKTGLCVVCYISAERVGWRECDDHRVGGARIAHFGEHAGAPVEAGSPVPVRAENEGDPA